MKTLIFSGLTAAVACATHVEWLACISFIGIGISFLDCLMAVLGGDDPELP